VVATPGAKRQNRSSVSLSLSVLKSLPENELLLLSSSLSNRRENSCEPFGQFAPSFSTAYGRHEPDCVPPRNAAPSTRQKNISVLLVLLTAPMSPPRELALFVFLLSFWLLFVLVS